MGLQAQLSQQRAMMGVGMQGMFSAPGNMAGTGGVAFNTANADISAARATFAIMPPMMPGGPFGPGAAGQAQLFSPAAEVGFGRYAAMQMGLMGAPANVLPSDVAGVMGMRGEELRSQLTTGFGLQFAMPALAGGGVSAALGGMGMGTGLLGGATLGGVGAAIGVGMLGEAAFSQLEQERQRSRILQATGTPEGMANDLVQGMSSRFTDPAFSQVSQDDLTQLIGQQAFARRLNPQTGEQVQQALKQLTEDLKSVMDIRRSLNLTFEEAQQFMGLLDTTGVRGQGQVRGFLGNIRATGQFGFTPGEQREMAVDTIHSAQAAQMAGVDPRLVMGGAGALQVHAAQMVQLSQLARGGEDPMLRDNPALQGTLQHLGTVAPTPQAMADALKRGGAGMARTGFMQMAMMAAFTGEGGFEEGLARLPGILAQGPAGASGILTDAMQGDAAQVSARLLRAQRMLPIGMEAMKNDPSLMAAGFGASVELMESMTNRKLSLSEVSELARGVFGIDFTAAEALAATWEKAGRDMESFRTMLKEAQEAAVKQIQDGQSELEGSFVAQMKGVGREVVDSLAGVARGLDEFLGNLITTANSYFKDKIQEHGRDRVSRQEGVREGPLTGKARALIEGVLTESFMQDAGASRADATGMARGVSIPETLINEVAYKLDSDIGDSERGRAEMMDDIDKLLGGGAPVALFHGTTGIRHAGKVGRDLFKGRGSNPINSSLGRQMMELMGEFMDPDQYEIGGQGLTKEQAQDALVSRLDMANQGQPHDLQTTAGMRGMDQLRFWATHRDVKLARAMESLAKSMGRTVPADPSNTGTFH